MRMRPSISCFINYLSRYMTLSLVNENYPFPNWKFRRYSVTVCGIIVDEFVRLHSQFRCQQRRQGWKSAVVFRDNKVSRFWPHVTEYREVMLTHPWGIACMQFRTALVFWLNLEKYQIFKFSPFVDRHWIYVVNRTMGRSKCYFITLDNLLLKKAFDDIHILLPEFADLPPTT